MTTDDRVTQQNLTGQQEIFPSRFYYPFGQLPELRLLLYAGACVQVVLTQREDYQKVYSLICDAWGLPGCQLLVNEYKRHIPDTWNGVREAVTLSVKGLIPKGREDTLTKLDLEHNRDYQTLRQAIGYLIVYGFNRKQDLENLKPKIIPKNSLYLVRSIYNDSLIEFGLQARQRARECGQPIVNTIVDGVSLYETGGKLFDLALLMGMKHSTREGRQLKQNIVGTLKKKGFTLCHDETTLRGAEMWYKCRVNPGTIEQYISDESSRIDQQAEQLSSQELESYYHNKQKLIYPERSNIETAIAPFDDATGYPRKWRK